MSSMRLVINDVERLRYWPGRGVSRTVKGVKRTGHGVRRTGQRVRRTGRGAGRTGHGLRRTRECAKRTGKGVGRTGQGVRRTKKSVVPKKLGWREARGSKSGRIPRAPTHLIELVFGKAHDYTES